MDRIVWGQRETSRLKGSVDGVGVLELPTCWKLACWGRWGSSPGFYPSMEDLESQVSHNTCGWSLTSWYYLYICSLCFRAPLRLWGIGVFGGRVGVVAYRVWSMGWGMFEVCISRNISIAYIFSTFQMIECTTILI